MSHPLRRAAARRGDTEDLRQPHGATAILVPGHFEGTSRFEVISRLGAGGMGVVYDVIDRERGERVALKALCHVDAHSVLRFKQEFRALQDLHHDNLVTLGELIEDRGQWFFTMELVDGVNFIEYVRPSGRPAEGPADDDAHTMEIRPPSRLARGSTAPGDRLDTLKDDDQRAFDESRLRASLFQLAQGLVALHDAGKVHRDIKPSNILVTHEGRVVLVDFGLVTDGRMSEHSAAHEVAGTVSFMAPEQAESRPLGPPADCYAVGVLLYVVLTGGLPFPGSASDIIRDKLRGQPVPVHQHAPGAPPDLASLTMELLATAPAARPTMRQVLRRLGGTTAAGRTAVESRADAPFVGRARELRALRGQLERVRAGNPLALVVQGESGVGKSTLVDHFVDELERDGDVLVLRGRCYEHESVPYKGVDGVIDSLSRHLRRLGADERRALRPAHSTQLVQVFPVLGRVPELCSARAGRSREPQEVRARAFASLRELLIGLGSRRPILLIIEDLQWSDDDSTALLRELLRDPGAPRLMLLATLRETDAEAARGSPMVDLAEPPVQVGWLRLGPLSGHHAEQMACDLLADAGIADSSRAATIAAEAGGHPMFVAELVRDAAAHGGRMRTPLRLDGVLWARIEGLDRPERDAVELLALSDNPLPQAAAAAALDVEFGELAARLSRLRRARLVRTSGPRPWDSVEVYHARIRDAVRAQLGAAARERWHGELARALEASGSGDPESLSHHCQQAGRKEDAARYAAAAAGDAVVAFAFERAARLYHRALCLSTEGGADALQLNILLADALAKAGRGVDAAERYLSAANRTPSWPATELRRRAATQLLSAGHVDRGLALLRTVLAAVGLDLPDTPRRSLVRTALRRAEVRLRVRRAGIGEARELSPADIVRMDACWSAAVGLAMVNVGRGAEFQSRHLLMAARLGEPSRLVRALAMEIAYTSVSGVRSLRRVRWLTDLAADIVSQLDDPHARGLVVGASGVAAYQRGDWALGRELCGRAAQIFRDACVGAWWEIATMQQYDCAATCHMGELAALGERLPRLLREAVTRGDRLAATNLAVTVPQFAWLVDDDVAGARRAAGEAMRGWSRERFDMPHYNGLHAETQLDLYAGDGQTAHDRLREHWPALAGSQLLRVQNVRIWMLDLRGRATLAAARTSMRSERLLRAAGRDARRLDHEGVPWAAALAAMLRAGIAVARGDAGSALESLARAEQGFAGTSMALHRFAARRLHGQLLGGQPGARMIAEADQWMRVQSVRSTPRLTTMLAPMASEMKGAT